jgi:hypothetical protein
MPAMPQGYEAHRQRDAHLPTLRMVGLTDEMLTTIQYAS